MSGSYFANLTRSALEYISSIFFKVELEKPTQTVVIKLKGLAYTAIESSRLVFIPNSDNSAQMVVYLNSVLNEEQTIEMEFLIQFDSPINKMEGYFWNGGTKEKVDYFDIIIESYKK